jgi:hypothetical protein
MQIGIELAAENFHFLIGRFSGYNSPAIAGTSLVINYFVSEKAGQGRDIPSETS